MHIAIFVLLNLLLVGLIIVNSIHAAHSIDKYVKEGKDVKRLYFVAIDYSFVMFNIIVIFTGIGMYNK